MKKRLLTLFLALALSFGLAAPAFASSGDFVIENGVLIDYQGPGAEYEPVEMDPINPVKNIVVPNGVTEIGMYALAYCGADSITIPDGVTTIDAAAFAHSTMFYINIPNSVTQIDGSAFAYCMWLTTVTISNSVTKIADGMFVYCYRLTNVTIPDSVTTIGEQAFFCCESLTDLTIPSSVTEIGQEAFGECGSLTIHGKAGSYAERYAKENGIPFVDENAATPAPDPTPATFTDTPSWCAKEAQWAVEQGITNGAGSADRFAPTQDCAHEQILTFLWRAAGRPSAAQAPVTVASYYQDGVNWAYEKGFLDSSFQPSAPCTRAQAVWYIWKALGEPPASKTASFSDVDAGSVYLPAVSWAVEKGVTNGYGGDDAFAPGRVCGRGEIACFLYRAYN